MFLQNSCPKTVWTLLKGFWFIIVGVLLLGHTSVLAEPYLRVYKNGVIYYYFPNQKHPPPRQTAIAGPNPRVEPNAQPEGVSLQVAPSLLPLMPGTAEDLQVVNPDDVQGMIWARTDYLVRVLTKLGYRYPLALPAYAAGLRRVEGHKGVPAIEAPQIVVSEERDNLLKYAQEQPAEPVRAQQGSACFQEPGPLSYCFPVAGPFSFRDSWGDYRSGGRHHRAVDIFAREGSEVYAVTTGVVDSLATLRGAGITLFLRGQDGKGYGYMHLQGYAPGIVEGKAIRTGELLGYVGCTGTRTSAAHLHFQVYADQRLCKNELLNPYYFLVQLCHGIGVIDSYQDKIARLEPSETRVNRIQVYRRPESVALRGPGGQFSVKDSSVLVIKNF